MLELFQWKNEAEVNSYVKHNKTDVEEELADVVYWVLLMAANLDIDIVAASEKKLAKDAMKYPVDKARGNHKKYTEL